MARFQLNLAKPNNYAFFCPQSRLHLTVSSPVGYADEVTSAIIRGVKSGSVIDIDNVVNTAGSSNNKAEETETTAPKAAPAVEEPAAEPQQPKKRGGRKKNEQPAEQGKAAE